MIISNQLWQIEGVVEDILRLYTIYRIRYDWMRDVIKIQVKLRDGIYNNNESNI